mmetsp:Transcript_16900/g.46199  ORF Transcript_16900/g.46199 Transcript_16900/m.46199 type:complete len:357 (-) Transcript_16900:115-1185(-)
MLLRLYHCRKPALQGFEGRRGEALHVLRVISPKGFRACCTGLRDLLHSCWKPVVDSIESRRRIAPDVLRVISPKRFRARFKALPGLRRWKPSVDLRQGLQRKALHVLCIISLERQSVGCWLHVFNLGQEADVDRCHRPLRDALDVLPVISPESVSRSVRSFSNRQVFWTELLRLPLGPCVHGRFHASRSGGLIHRRQPYGAWAREAEQLRRNEFVRVVRALAQDALHGIRELYLEVVLVEIFLGSSHLLAVLRCFLLTSGSWSRIATAHHAYLQPQIPEVGAIDHELLRLVCQRINVDISLANTPEDLNPRAPGRGSRVIREAVEARRREPGEFLDISNANRNEAVTWKPMIFFGL